MASVMAPLRGNVEPAPGCAPMTSPRNGCFSGTLEPQGQRLALATISTGARLQSGIEIQYLQMGEGADLSALNRRAPFLLEHRKFLEDLLGSTEEAWVEDGKAYAIVRFADLPMANRVWTLLEQNFPISCSIGYSVISCRPIEMEGSAAYVVDRWQAQEVSAAVVVAGADAYAGIRPRPFAELAELRDQRRAARLERERAEKIAALKANNWRHWACNGAPDEIGAAAGVSPCRLRGPLLDAVERHLTELEAC